MKRIVLALTLLLSGFAFGVFTNADKAQFVYTNYAPNPGAEGGRLGYTASAGTFTTTTTTANVAQGATSFSWDGSATGQTLTSSQVSVPSGLFGANCLIKVRYKTAEASVPYVLEAIDGSSNVLGAVTLNVSSSFTDAIAAFICPASGTFAARVRTSSSAGDPAVVYLDEFWLGRNYLIANISQATLVGEVYAATTANCTGWSRSNTAFGDFSSDADCPAWTIVTNPGPGTIATANSNLPQVVVNNLPPGVYQVEASGHIGNGTASAFQQLAITDGTTTTANWQYRQSASTEGAAFFLSGVFVYTTAQSSKTFKFQGAASSGSITIDNATSTATTYFRLIRFPSALDRAISVDQAGWYIDASISGASPSLGISNVTSYTGIENGSLTMTQNTGSSTAWIPCSSTNDSSGTTCAAGSESVGVSFTIPYTGLFMGCVSFGWNGYTGDGGTAGSVFPTFQVVETPNAAQTILQEGKSRIQSGVEVVAPATVRYSGYDSTRVCGTFTFTSVGRKTLRLMYEQQVGGTVNSSNVIGDADAARGQRDIHWEVYPVTRAWPMPVIVGGVSSNTSGQERVERATIACNGSSSVTSQSGTWISTIGNIASSTSCTLGLAAGIFSSSPSCVASEAAGNGRTIDVTVSSSSSVTTRCQTDAGSACSNHTLHIICMGPK